VVAQAQRARQALRRVLPQRRLRELEPTHPLRSHKRLQGLERLERARVVRVVQEANPEPPPKRRRVRTPVLPAPVTCPPSAGVGPAAGRRLWVQAQAAVARLVRHPPPSHELAGPQQP
jgi:hypothetical protein